MYLSRSYRGLYFTDSAHVPELVPARHRVPISSHPKSSSSGVPEPHVPESHVSKANVLHPRPTFSHSRIKATFLAYLELFDFSEKVNYDGFFFIKVLKKVHQKSPLGRIKFIANFCKCRRILDIFDPWFLNMFCYS